MDFDKPSIKELIGEKEYIAYSVGALLYTPAINTNVAEKIENHSFEKNTSVAICLEDSILDEAVLQAEENLVNTLARLSRFDRSALPLLFVRIRTPEHLMHVHRMLGELESVITGYVLPKFDILNAERYRDIILNVNRESVGKVYFMPILESEAVANVQNRSANLTMIKEILDPVKDYVLNIRVGGNDLCNLYGLRRSVEDTVYDIGVVRDVLVDIINVFATDYVVSGPVWDHFGEAGGAWEEGLRRELRLDRLNGFIGKTAIHPSQLGVIYDSLSVRRADYDDALRILFWDSKLSGVQSSADKSRMNEVKCHSNWAKKILILGEIYGVKES